MILRHRSDGLNPLQRSTGILGYFGKSGSLRESLQKRKTDPRVFGFSFAFTQLSHNPKRVIGRKLLAYVWTLQMVIDQAQEGRR